MKKRALTLFVVILVILILLPTNAIADDVPFLGSGTSVDPYLISDADDLSALAGLINVDSSAYADKHYLQTQDIDLSHVSDWTPIGSTYSYAFAGTYDGGGHSISGLDITFATAKYDFGMFGYVVSGTIKDMHIADGSITGSPDVGVIANHLENGTIENCRSDIDITVVTDVSWTYAGGIVAHVSTDSVISGCSNTGDININGESMRVGGIASAALNNVTITDCANKGSIDVEGNMIQAGGIVGLFATATSRSSVNQCYNSGSIFGNAPGFNISNTAGIVGQGTKVDIVNCYNAGSIQSISGGTSSAGGIFGNATADDNTIQKCYNTGQISGGTIGGIAGTFPSALSDCFYSDTCPQAVGSGSGTATSATLEELKQQATFTGFDFSTVWTLGMAGETGYEYPQLQNNLLYVSQHNVTLTADSEKGSVQGDGAYTFQDIVTIIATPNAQYAFSNWDVVSGSVVLADATAATTTFSMPTTDVTINAVFENKQYNVVLQDNGHGSAAGAGAFAWGDTVNISATADSGYQFMNWNVVSGGAVISDSTKMNASFEMPQSDVTIEAVFDVDPPEYTYTVTDEEATITDYTGTESIVDIPSRLGGYPVTAIGANAFSNSDTVTSITVPDSITSIGQSAFRYCDLLESIDLGDNITSIENSTFSECVRLASITIPDSVNSVGNLAFMGCSDLTDVTIGKGVTSVSDSAFQSCTSISGFHVDSANLNIKDEDGVLYNKTGTTLICYPAGIIGSYAVEVGVTEVGKFAFYKCSLLTDVTLPSSVETIGDYAFGYCTNLASIEIPDFVTTIGVQAFTNCDSLNDVDLGSNTQSIKERAFYNCGSLSSVEIPSKVDTVGNHAFYGCYQLESVYFWGTQPSIGDDAFTGVDPEFFKVYYHVSEAASWATYTETKQVFCKLTKDLQDGYAPEPEIAHLTNFKLSEPEDPSWATKRFTGWFKESACTTLWDFYNDVVTDDVTLYAGWRQLVTSVSLNKSEVALAVNGTETLTATVYPSDAFNKNVSWSSSHSSVATVSNGVVTARSVGSATIIVSTHDGSHTDSCVVTVTQPVSDVTLSKSTMNLHIGGIETLAVNVYPSDATNREVTWSTSNSNVATVFGGTITAKNTGTATITVTSEDGEHTAACVVTVTQPVTDVALNKSDIYMLIGETATLTATVSPSNAANKNVVWATSRASIVTVSNGVITAKSAGTATITVTTEDGGYIDTCTVTVGMPSVRYQTHVQNVGWQGWKYNGEAAGTSGRSLRLEGMYIEITGRDNALEYRTHVQNIGWQDWVSDGEMTGTSGRSLRLEAIDIRLKGKMAEIYDIYYRVHAQNFGWMDWAKNGQSAGTAGYAYRLEAIEIVMVEKGGAAPGPTTMPFKDKNGTTPVTPPVNPPVNPPVKPPSTDDSVKYQTHVQNVGWQGWKYNGDSAGTSGRSLRLEGMYIEIIGQDNAIEYRTHVQNIGWQDWVSDGEMTGTSGRSLRLEAIDIRLTGQMAAKYDIYYRVHAQNVGWMDWAKNGQSAGTAGFSYRLEAIQIVLVEKGGAAPGPTTRPFISAYTH